MSERYGGRIIYRARDEHGVIDVVEDAFHRSLHFGTAPRQSSMRLSDPAALVLSYTRAMLCGLLFQEPPRSALVIGLGGGSLAKFLLHHFPACRVTAVELRPAVVEVAHDYFALPRKEPRLELVIEDGGRFMRTGDGRFTDYDLLLVDAFHDSGMSESVDGFSFFDACRCRLSERGMLAINLWLEERESLRDSLDLLSTCFSGSVFRLPVPGKGNLITFATKTHLSNLPQDLTLRARTLSVRYGVEFPLFLKELRKTNRLFRSR